MKSGIMVLWGCTILLSCNAAKDSMQETVTGSLEKVLESQTGTTVDLGDADAYSENSGSVEFSAGGTKYLKKEEKLQAVALIQKDEDGLALSFQLAGAEGKSLAVIASHIPENFTLPLRARFTVSNSFDGETPVATLLFMQADNGRLNVPIPYEGVLIINRLNEKEMSFEVQAKGGLANQTDSPSSWEPIIVSGVLKSPIIQTFGIDKQKVLK